jgi:HAD superfamily hydrolase (TIGR01509 family)
MNNGWAVLFDVDGTMVDNRAYHEKAWIELGGRYGFTVTPQEYREHIHARSNDRNVRRLFGVGVDDEFVRRISDEKEEIYRVRFRPVIREIPGLSNLLAELHETGIPCAAVSNSPPENVNMVLDELRIRRYFRTALNVRDVRRGKPDPEIILAAAAFLGLPVGTCVVIEDSISGFRAAEAAGASYVVVTEGADPDDLSYASAACAVHRDFTTLSVRALEACVRGTPGLRGRRTPGTEAFETC